VVLLRSDGDWRPAYSGFDGWDAIRIFYGAGGRTGERSGELEVPFSTKVSSRAEQELHEVKLLRSRRTPYPLKLR